MIFSPIFTLVLGLFLIFPLCLLFLLTKQDLVLNTIDSIKDICELYLDF